MRSTACVKALTHRVARWQKGGARALAGAFLREEEKDWELQRNAKSLRVWPPSSPAELSPTRQRKNWRDGRSVIQSQSGPGMRGQRSLLPTLALPLALARRVMARHWPEPSETPDGRIRDADILANKQGAGRRAEGKGRCMFQDLEVGTVVARKSLCIQDYHGLWS